MNEREGFLRAIEANEGDELTHLVFADWLDEHGEHEEAERQRKIPAAKKWLDDICREYNAGSPEGPDRLTCDRLLEFGRNASATASMSIEVSTDIPDGHLAATIRDRIPEFWQAWSVVTGLPLAPDIERKCYYSSGYCCANEVYPDTHVAGPKSAEIIRAEEERARFQQQQELEEEEFRQRLEGEKEETRREKFEMIQDELEKDRP